MNTLSQGLQVRVVHLHCGEMALRSGVVVSAPTDHQCGSVVVHSEKPFDRVTHDMVLDPSDPLLIREDEFLGLVDPEVCVERFKGRLGRADAVLVSQIARGEIPQVTCF